MFLGHRGFVIRDFAGRQAKRRLNLFRRPRYWLKAVQSREKMRILITNDDGIYAQGLLALHRALIQDHEIYVVAPDSEMSAVGHAITLSSPLRVREIYKNGTFFGYAVKGTPADCVKIAVQELMEQPPDIILSGINPGANVGVNVLYSGTVSAATEGAFLGVPSAAISLNSRIKPDFTFASFFSRQIVRFVLEVGLSGGTALNVNIPALPPEKIRGVSIVRQGTVRFEERFERRMDPRGNIYYWLAGEGFTPEESSGTDFADLREKWITITPVHYDLTCYKELEKMKDISVSGGFDWGI